MKNFIFIALLCFNFIPSLSQNGNVKRVIKKYDTQYLRTIEGVKHPGNFWYSVACNNKRAKEIEEGIKNQNKTLGEALVTLNYVQENTPHNDYYSFGYDSIKIQLSSDLGIDRLTQEKPIIIISDGTINASMDWTGQMRIFRGSISILTYNELLAVCAHEIAHFVCKHAISRTWKAAKKAKTNKMWADIGVSVFMGAMVAAGGSNAYYGLDNSYIDQITSNADLFYYRGYDYANDATTKYTYRYNRDEESEADIIAYRFMEYMGYGGEHVISMLKKLLFYYGDEPETKYKNHPSISFRIEVLEAMQRGDYDKKAK